MSENYETVFIRLAVQEESAEIAELISHHISAPWRQEQEEDAKPRLGAELFEFKKVIVAVAGSTQEIIAVVRIRSLAGLPLTEGMGEVYDLVVDQGFRQKNIGTQLIYSVIEFARETGFKRLYLKTSPEMEVAQKLFKKFGFKAVRLNSNDELINFHNKKVFPCYFVLENLSIPNGMVPTKVTRNESKLNP